MDAMDVVHALREGKELLRRRRRNASVDQKIYDLWRAQHLYVQVVGSRRPLMAWERPWNIMNDVRDAIVIKDGEVEARSSTSRVFSASRSHWVRPHQSWILEG